MTATSKTKVLSTEIMLYNGTFCWGFQAEALTLKETRKREVGVKRKTFECQSEQHRRWTAKFKVVWWNGRVVKWWATTA
jgi:hypothetical protein